MYLFVSVPVQFICSFSAEHAQRPFDSSTGVCTHRSTRNYFYLFIFLLLFCLTTKTYLSPQLLVYMPIDVSVHYPTCSFWLFHSDRPFVLTCPLTCSKYSQIYPFINQPVPFVGVFQLALHAHLSVICWSAYRQTHPKMNVPVHFDGSGYNHEDSPANSTVYMSIDAPVQKLSPFIFMHPFRTTSTIYQSTQLLLYIHTDLPGNKSTSLSWCFPPANLEDLPVD